MTDNEKLIEELRSVEHGSIAGTHAAGSPILRGADLARRAADALEAAEKAHTPTDDEREALADRLARRLIDDPEQLMLAEGTGALHVALSESIRSTIEDVYADCGDSDPGVLSSNIARRLAWDLPPAILSAAGFRRSEVPEPSALPEYVEVGHPTGERQPVEPQGEPSDARIRQAVLDGLAEASALQSPFQPQMRELVVEQITLALRAGGVR